MTIENLCDNLWEEFTRQVYNDDNLSAGVLGVLKGSLENIYHHSLQEMSHMLYDAPIVAVPRSFLCFQMKCEILK